MRRENPVPSERNIRRSLKEEEETPHMSKVAIGSKIKNKPKKSTQRLLHAGSQSRELRNLRKMSAAITITIIIIFILLLSWCCTSTETTRLVRDMHTAQYIQPPPPSHNSSWEPGHITDPGSLITPLSPFFTRQPRRSSHCATRKPARKRQ